MNNVILLGRLTAAPELKTTTSGASVVSFTLAVDRKFKTKDGEKITDFINCVAWRGTAEFVCKYFKKGDPLGITGEIQTRKWQDKDGNNRTSVEVVLHEAHFVPSNGNKGDQPKIEPPPGFVETQDAYDADLPFWKGEVQ